MSYSWAAGCKNRAGVDGGKERQAGKRDGVSAGTTTLWTARDGNAVSSQAGRELGSLIAYGTSRPHVGCLNIGLCSFFFFTHTGLLRSLPFYFFYSITYPKPQLLGPMEMGWKTREMGFLGWELGEGWLFPEWSEWTVEVFPFQTKPELSCNFAVTFAILKNEIRHLPSSWQKEHRSNNNWGAGYKWGCVIFFSFPPLSGFSLCCTYHLKLITCFSRICWDQR